MSKNHLRFFSPSIISCSFPGTAMAILQVSPVAVLRVEWVFLRLALQYELIHRVCPLSNKILSDSRWAVASSVRFIRRNVTRIINSGAQKYFKILFIFFHRSFGHPLLQRDSTHSWITLERFHGLIHQYISLSCELTLQPWS